MTGDGTTVDSQTSDSTADSSTGDDDTGDLGDSASAADTGNVGTDGTDATPCETADDCPPSSDCELVACLAGQCVAGPVADGSPCDDDDPCSTGDSCVNGACTSTVEDCDDGLPCTTDTCTDTGCEYAGVIGCCFDIADCNDRDPCNGEEDCDLTNNTCVAGEPLVCDDGVVCTADSCGEQGCMFAPVANCCGSDADCDDGDACTGTETCDLETGTCGAGTPMLCDSGHPCTAGSCAAGVCTFAPIAGCCVGDNDCNDSSWCNGEETCDLATNTCQAGVAPSCDDGDACTADGCSQGTCAGPAPPEQCFCTHVEIANCCETNADCTDFDWCNGTETCDVTTNTCVQGPAPSCDDGNPCTVDTCSSQELCPGPAPPSVCNCMHTPIAGCCAADTDCYDGSWCNGEETCNLSTNTCQAGTPPSCDDGNSCTQDSCVDKGVCFGGSTPFTCNCEWEPIGGCQ